MSEYIKDIILCSNLNYLKQLFFLIFAFNLILDVHKISEIWDFCDKQDFVINKIPETFILCLN